MYYSHLGINSFAKMASDLTTAVGCAYFRADDAIYIICQYKTELTEGSKLYENGVPCRQCPLGEASCVNGLCPVDQPTSAPPG
ncbi:unnamed protein product [Strongylus vulgaris]|uniref:SCP domain-containing protein n=1 Tax=Strongylus vulgaris TaxID=40348 RepID=A0A3P7J439_STRVU|nr:unnamed protein product [Strongylus vulgaris]